MTRKELTQAELNAVLKLDRESNISISETNYRSGIYGINWPGKGTKTTVETKAFIRDLLKAVKLAEKINKRK